MLHSPQEARFPPKYEEVANTTRNIAQLEDTNSSNFKTIHHRRYVEICDGQIFISPSVLSAGLHIAKSERYVDDWELYT